MFKYMGDWVIRLPEVWIDELQLGAGDELSCKLAQHAITIEKSMVKHAPRAQGGAAMHIGCFGQFELTIGGDHIWISNRKAMEMLAYLVCEGGGPVSKEAMACALWPDAPGDIAFGRLYKLCSYWRVMAQRGVGLPLYCRRGSLYLDMTGVETDIGRFTALCASADISNMESAVLMYRPLLAQECYDWSLFWMMHYETQYLNALTTLVDYFEATGQPMRAHPYKKMMNSSMCEDD